MSLRVLKVNARNRVTGAPLRVMAAIIAMALAAAPGFAQCAMCKAALSASSSAGSFASRFNLAVLVLLVPPVAIFVGIFGFVYRHRNSFGDSEKP